MSSTNQDHNNAGDSSAPDDVTLANYRRVIEQATAHDPAIRSATAAVFAALDRRDAREREMWAIVRDVANLQMRHLSSTRLTSSALVCPICIRTITAVSPTEIERHDSGCPVARACALLANTK